MPDNIGTGHSIVTTVMRVVCAACQFVDAAVPWVREILLRLVLAPGAGTLGPTASSRDTHEIHSLLCAAGRQRAHLHSCVDGVRSGTLCTGVERCHVGAFGT